MEQEKAALGSRAAYEIETAPLLRQRVRAFAATACCFSTTAASATFTAPGVYVLQLTAGDGQLSASDTVTISVTPKMMSPHVRSSM